MWKSHFESLLSLTGKAYVTEATGEVWGGAFSPVPDQSREAAPRGALDSSLPLAGAVGWPDRGPTGRMTRGGPVVFKAESPLPQGEVVPLLTSSLTRGPCEAGSGGCLQTRAGGPPRLCPGLASCAPHRRVHRRFWRPGVGSGERTTPEPCPQAFRGLTRARRRGAADTPT